MTRKVRGYQRDTWIDWQGPDAPENPLLVGRADLLRIATTQGLSIPESTLHYWQTNGIIPHPTLAKAGRARYALYPTWIVDLFHEIRRLQERGVDLDQLPAIARRLAPQLAAGDSQPPPDITIHCPCCGQPLRDERDTVPNRLSVYGASNLLN